MSISKNFVVKNGFETSTDLILANADTRRVGVGTTAPEYTLHVNGGIGVTNAYVSGIGTFVDELNVGLGGTVLTVLGIGNSIGIGTALPAFLLDIRSPVSTGQTALFVQGDVRITGDLNLDDVTLDDALIQDLTVTDTFIVAGLSTFNSNVFINAALNVSGITTLGSYVDINDSVDISGALNVSGVSTFGGYVDINNSVDIGVDLNVVGLTTLGGYVDINNSVDIGVDLNVVGVTTLATADINAGEVDVTRIGTSNLNVSGIATIATISVVGAALSNLIVSGISTLGTVEISSGIITATSGIVTYFGDGQHLDLTNNASTGIGIGTTGGVVGYGITFIDFYGAGVSTTFYNGSLGIATIFFEGGGGGGGTIGIGTEFPLSSVNGDLFFSAEFGRLFIYYDENIIGVGTDEYWIDAAPFNVGIITALTNVSFSPGSALAPSMFFIGDNQTGFFSPGNGQFTVVSSGSSVLNVNASGIRVTGVTTITNASGTVTIGIGTTALLVEGNARVTGILTVGSSSITLDGITNTINVGTGLTLSSSGIVAGVITATSFSGDGSGLTGVANTANIVSNTITVGVLTATSINVPPQPITFNPTDGATDVALGTNIVITFSQQVQKGTGNITLRNSSGIGTILQTIGVTSTSVTISGAVVTIDPPDNLPITTDTFVVVDAGAFTSVSFNSPTPLIDTYNFVTQDFAFSSIVPANDATAVALNTNITLTFTSPPVRGTGTIELRRDTVGGTIIESFNAASSDRISISSDDYIIDPTSNIPDGPTTIFLVIPNTAINGYVGLNTAGADTHSFATIAAPALGASFEGGFLICKASPLRWVVSPFSAQVSRTWYLRNDANTTAQSASGCTGWFVPTVSQLQNPGYCCRSFWGPSPCFSSATYWSSTEGNAGNACNVYFTHGGAYSIYKGATRCVRAFRCVTY